MYEINEATSLNIIFDDICFACIEFILNNLVNFLTVRNNRFLVSLCHTVNGLYTLSNCKVSMSFVSDIFIIDHRKEKGVPICISIIHFESDI
jgi:hypothetical protein